MPPPSALPPARIPFCWGPPPDTITAAGASFFSACIMDFISDIAVNMLLLIVCLYLLSVCVDAVRHWGGAREEAEDMPLSQAEWARLSAGTYEYGSV
ncbi:hypothetical protein Tdes44962_MAKER00123 [Teratosphaeria destructans]|uniref:Uncharacterized protein n=1 Tax=Teratosphaeria destructans TaxID=418781 RepID=A0A9W7W7R8_9PEZI|nr:hypothetical protein Tdes44962_MAKER00123 [Teratosphaeria destructans]